ncbi:ATP-binding protein [Citrobacter koseri]|uniref:ATP-binding protein n=1 Tax=Citrobacter koseri TaxID=545 RepID=UPI003892B9DD
MLIFVAGVHGVGKGYLCKKALDRLDILHKSASELIKENSTTALNKDKHTDNVDRNQLTLIQALTEYKKNNANLLLDGHFALLDKDGRIKDITQETFSGMNIDYVILISESEETIRERIRTRDGIEINYALNELIEHETQNAMYITSELNIPFYELKSPTSEDFIKKIHELGVSEK